MSRLRFSLIDGFVLFLGVVIGTLLIMVWDSGPDEFSITCPPGHVTISVESDRTLCIPLDLLVDPLWLPNVADGD